LEFTVTESGTQNVLKAHTQYKVAHSV